MLSCLEINKLESWDSFRSSVDFSVSPASSAKVSTSCNELSPAPSITSPPITATKVKKGFRRSLSDSTHDTLPPVLNKRKGMLMNNPRARSFDEKNNSQEDDDVVKVKRRLPRSASSVGGSISQFLRRGSISIASVLLSRAPTRADSWVSSDNDTGRRDDLEEDIKKYDALFDRSGHSRHHSAALSSSATATSAVFMEKGFREENDRGNVDQFRRVLIMLAMYYMGHALTVLGVDAIDWLALGVVLVALFYMRVFEDAFKKLQTTGVVLTIVLILFHWYAIQDFVSENVILGLNLAAFVFINIHLRLRFVIACGVSAVLLGVLFLFAFQNSCGYGGLAYYTSIVVFTLSHVYAKEKKIRADFKHLQILKHDSNKSRVLIENMVPQPSHAKQLLLGELVFDELHNVTLLYSDIRGFTPLSAKMKPQVLCKLLNLIYSAFDRHLEHFGLYKIGE